MLSPVKMFLSVFVQTGGRRHLLSSRAPPNLHLICPSIIQGKSKQWEMSLHQWSKGNLAKSALETEESVEATSLSRMKGNPWVTWYLESQVPPPRGCAAACRALYHNWKNATTVRGKRCKGRRSRSSEQWKRCQMVGWVTSRHKTLESVRRSTSLGFILRQRWWCPAVVLSRFEQNVVGSKILGVLLVHAGKLRFGVRRSFVRNQHVQMCQPYLVKKNHNHGICQN